MRCFLLPFIFPHNQYIQIGDFQILKNATFTVVTRQCITDAKPAISTSSFTSTGTGLSDKSSYCPFVSCRTSGLENTLAFASRPILLATKPCLNCPLYPSPDQPHLLATFMTPHP